MRLLYLPSAIDDLEWFNTYYSQTFPEGEGRAWHAVAAAEALLIAQPHIGVAVPEFQDVRALRVGKTPFSFIYRIRPDLNVIEVGRVWDGRQDPEGLEFT